jgi:hypothetical protein
MAKSILYSLGVVMQLSGLAATLYPCLALFNPAADLRTMLYLAAFGGGLFCLGWLCVRAAR